MMTNTSNRPSYTLHLHDSEVSSVQVDAATACLRMRLSAAFVQRAPEGSAGHLRGVTLQFDGAQWQGDLALCLGRIASGHVQLADGTRLTRLALPAQWRQPGLRAELNFGHGGTLLVWAAALHIDAGDGGYTESLAC